MNDLDSTTTKLRDAVLAASRLGKRRLIALAGPPASGKSTLADAVAAALNAQDCTAQVVPMDGFHLHNQILIDRGLLPRKGAPETFDALGFKHLVARLPNEDEIFYPLFDRNRDIAIAGAGRIGPECDTVIIEGNYLLLDAPHWRDLTAHWDLSIHLQVADSTLRDRLTQRWLQFGLSQEQSIARAENDLPNARTVTAQSLPADIML
jgi:pantothenate kinase